MPTTLPFRLECVEAESETQGTRGTRVGHGGFAFGSVLLLCICHTDLLKELKNPVHGDRNKADDVSWPFYSAIDELLGGEHGDRRTPSHDEYIDPHEFLCVSVTPEEPTSSSMDATPLEPNPETESRGNDFQPEPAMRTFGGGGCSIEIERIPAIEAARFERSYRN